MQVRRALATASVIVTSILSWNLVVSAANADLTAPTAGFISRAPSVWLPPSWHPNPDALRVVTEMQGKASPEADRRVSLSARAAFVFDVDAGTVLFDRNADDIRPVASLTKLVSSLAMASEDPNLNQNLCIDAQFRPTRNGAPSKLSTGECYTGWDLFGAALVASDNRGAYGMQVVSGLGFDEFILRMDEVSRELGMSHSTWADPSGLEDENLSSARDIARAALAVAAHPVLSIAATAPSWHLERTDKDAHRTLGSTDRLSTRADLEVLAAKTGYTDTAGYCFAGVFRLENGRTVALSVLGANATGNRWRDVQKLLEAAENGTFDR
jgi:D-alanyl-D-alanine endopeptidase (penicillin-binding protein 7)